MVAKNDVTGDSIQSKVANEAYAANYDTIFNKPALPEGRVAVKDLKNRQVVYDREEGNSYRVYSAPKIVNGQWQVETTDEGDYQVFFYEHATLWASEAARDKELKAS